MARATSPYLNRPLRSEEQARADRAALQARLRAVHMLNATPSAPAPAAATVGAILACLLLITLLILVGLLTGILDW